MALGFDGFAALCLFLCLLVLGIVNGAEDIVPSSQVSEFLQQHGLPGGLLPDLVTSYKFSEDGTFVVHLDKECCAKFDNLVWYGTTVGGKLSYGKIENLSGIQAKELFVWISVTGIHVDESNHDYIYFDAGIVSKKLKASVFQKPPTCRKSINLFEDEVVAKASA